MKIKHLLIGLLAVAAGVACTQDELIEPSLEVGQESLSLTAEEATASFEVVSNVPWTATADEDWVHIEPASGEGAAEAVTVTVTADDNAAEEARTAVITVKAGELSFTLEVTQAAAEAEDPGDGGDGIEITELYMLGDACDAGWSLDAMTQFTLVEGVYVWEGNLRSGKAFRFPLQKVSGEFWPCLVPDAEGTAVVYAEDEIDNTFSVETDGYYKVTVNPETLAMTVERLGDRQESEPVLYILGGAINENADAGWKLENMGVFENNNEIYTWTGHLRRDEFRFPLKNDWWPCYMISGEGLDNLSLVLGVGDEDKTGYVVPQAGTYTITINLTDPENPTVALVLVEADPEVPVTYTVAGTFAQEGGYWLNAGAAGLMTLEGDYLVAKNLDFKWRSHCYDDATDQNWFEFKICETETWNGFGQGDGLNVANTAIDVTMGGNNILINSPEGLYDVYFDMTNGKVWVMNAGYTPGQTPELPEVSEVTYNVVGTIAGDGNQWNEKGNAGVMTLEGEYYVAKNLEFKLRSDLYEDSPYDNWFEFKICELGTWNGFGQSDGSKKNAANVEIEVFGGNNINVQAPSGLYDVYFDKANKKVWVMTPGYTPGQTPELPEEPVNPDFQVSELYMLGGACDTGWALSMITSFAKVGDDWVWEGNLTTVDAFRFPLQKNNTWWPCLVPNADGTAVVHQTDDPNSDYRVESDGYYKVTVTPLTGALTIERLGELRAPAFITELYMLGGGVPTVGWILDNMVNEKFTNEGGVFTWEGELTTDEFRFQPQTFDYAPALEAAEEGKLNYETDGNSITNLKVAEAGRYTIVVDARDCSNITYTITKVPTGPQVVTVAEFLAAAEDTTIEYQVSGTISGIYQAYNSSYNNISINISDDTGEMLAFRLSCEGIEDPANTLTKGDLITVKGTRTLYNEVPQMAQGCVIVSHEDVVVETPVGALNVSFADVANRTSFTTSQQVWEQNGVKVINDKATSTSSVADYSNPVRFYKSSKLTVEYPGMTKIVFACNNASYATALQSSITVGEVTVSSTDVTVVLPSPADSYEIVLSGGQVRMDSITVYAE